MKETAGWAVFACALALVVLVWTGTPWGSALLSMSAVLLLTAITYALARVLGLKLPHLDDDD